MPLASIDAPHELLDILGGAWLAAAVVECMNCSVRSFDSFMF